MKHVHFVRKRLPEGGARWYVYAWRGGPRVMLCDGPAKPRLSREAIQKISDASKPVPPADPKTLGELSVRWQASSDWKSLSAGTRATWATYLCAIERKWGKVPLAVFDDRRMTGKIVDWQESNADRPRAADLGVDVLRALLKHGIRRGLLRINAAAGVSKIYGGGQREGIVWLPAEIEAFTRKASELGREEVADALLLCTASGLRRQDLVTLTWQDIEPFAIVKKALKTARKKRRFACIPRVPELDALLEQLRTRPRDDSVETVLVNKGRPWTPDGLTKAVAEIREAMGGVVHIDRETGRHRQKHLHDGRGSYATRLMTHTDLGDDEVADIMGWSSGEVARIRSMYVDRAELHRAIGRRIAHASRRDRVHAA